MRLEIFVSTMHMEGAALPERLRAGGLDVTFINQCGREGKRAVACGGRSYRVVDSAERGLSRSRNLALDLAQGDLVWLVDDDLILDPACEERICRAFEEHPEADAIGFNVISDSPDRPQRLFAQGHRIQLKNALRNPTFRFVYRTARLREKGLRFREEFGSGSVYSSGEDSIFTVDCLRAGLTILALPVEAAHVLHTDSAWFQGFTEKYLHDKGAIMRAIFGWSAPAWCVVMLLRRREWRSEHPFPRALSYMLRGAREYARNYGR